VWYRGCNENDVDGIGSDPDSIRRRARFDIECATLLRNAAPNAKWVAGGFAHGNPDFTNAEVCKAVREAYADAYNSGLIMFDIHNYSKPAPGAPPKDFKTFGAIWLMRRWEFLFTHCGFDPNVRGIVSSETGHECGFGGFRAAGFTVNEFAEWCEYSLSVQLAPLVVNGVKYPSPMLVQTFFQHGNTYNGAGGWWGYGMDDYIEYLTGRWQGGAKALFEDMRGDTAFLYEGSQPDYVEPPAKDISR
jgi:hypothetical protein